MKLSSLLTKTVTVGENEWEVETVTLRRTSPEPVFDIPVDTRAYCLMALSYSTLRPMFMSCDYQPECRPDVTAHWQEAWVGTKEAAEAIAEANPDYAPCVFPAAWRELIIARDPYISPKYLPHNDPRRIRAGC